MPAKKLKTGDDLEIVEPIKPETRRLIVDAVFRGFERDPGEQIIRRVGIRGLMLKNDLRNCRRINADSLDPLMIALGWKGAGFLLLRSIRFGFAVGSIASSFLARSIFRFCYRVYKHGLECDIYPDIGETGLRVRAKREVASNCRIGGLVKRRF